MDYKKVVEIKKQKIIKKEIKRFKRGCLKEFRQNIKIGISETHITLHTYLRNDLREAASEIAIVELRKENPEIDFYYYYDGFMNSWKNMRMRLK